jgi:hypothetical protein
LVLAVGGCQAGHGGWGEEKEENEVKVPIEQVPAPVRATLEQQAPGVAIKEVDKESDDGKTVYEADAMLGGQNYEIKVAENGDLIKKKLDTEEGEKGEHEEKDGKDHQDKD